MTINKLVKELCKREGLKKQVDIAQMKEIVGHLADIFYENLNAYTTLYRLGEKRAKKKKK